MPGETPPLVREVGICFLLSSLGPAGNDDGEEGTSSE